MLCKLLGTQSFGRAALTFDQFIRSLKQVVAVSKTTRLFEAIASPCKKAYQVTFAGKPLRASVKSRNPNDSLELDLNIQEALQALKQRESSRPKTRHAGKSSRASDKQSFETSPDSPLIKSKAVPRKSLDEDPELQEFLELERKVNEVAKVTVNLTDPLKPTARPRKKPLLRQHRQFIQKLRNRTFSSPFVLRLVFAAWKAVTCKVY